MYDGRILSSYTLQSSQEFRIRLWAIGRTWNEVFHFHGQLTSSLLGISPLPLLCLLSRLVSVGVSAFDGATSNDWNKMVPPIGHFSAPGLLESHLICSGNGLLFFLGENIAENVCSLHSCLPAKCLLFFAGKHQVKSLSQKRKSRG